MDHALHMEQMSQFTSKDIVEQAKKLDRELDTLKNLVIEK
jgi:hypothetical protein